MVYYNETKQTNQTRKSGCSKFWLIRFPLKALYLNSFYTQTTCSVQNSNMNKILNPSSFFWLVEADGELKTKQLLMSKFDWFQNADFWSGFRQFSQFSLTFKSVHCLFNWPLESSAYFWLFGQLFWQLETWKGHDSDLQRPQIFIHW
jgi:hypothetical protein